MITRITKIFIISIYFALFLVYSIIAIYIHYKQLGNLYLHCVTIFFILILILLSVIFIIFFNFIKYRIETSLSDLSKNFLKIKYRENLILNSINEGVCWLNEKGNIIFANRSAKYILGYENDDEIIGKNFHKLVHREEEEVDEKCAVEMTIKNGTCNIFRRSIFYKKDGSPIHVAVFTSPIIEENKVTGAVITFIDLSYELKQEEEIKKYHTIIEQASAIVVITDKDGNIQYVNPMFEKVTGYKKEEAIGQNPRILKSGKHPQSFYENLWNTILSGKTWEGEFINKKKDGSLYFEEATIFPIKDINGEIINFVAIRKDITKTKELEEQLLQAQKLEAIGRLTGGIAHDFNNILTILSGYTEMLENSIDKKSRQFNYLIKLKDAIDRASELVNKLLAFSRKQPFNPKPVDLVDEVKKLEKMLKRLISEDIVIKFTYDVDSIIIYADTTQIEQILINLIVNARDAIYEKKDSLNKEIEVRIGKRKLKGIEYAKISVKDTGIGIPKTLQKKIFEPFFTTKKAGVGTGLGLSTVYGIVMQNNGKIKVDSEYGKGTKFIIYLPVYEKSDYKENEREDKIISLPKGNGKILVVEDELDIRKILKDNLSALGYSVLEASNGMEALQILEEKKYNIDLIISDLIMPEMDGNDLYREVQKKNPLIKFLFISGYTDDVLSEIGISIKNLNFLKKPFNIKDIAIKIKEILK